MQGWIKLHRKLQEHWLYQEKRKFSRYEAWLDLLMMVNHKDNKIMQDGELIEVKRGERITSIRQLMERWDWSNTKVTKFLKMLKQDGMITYKITPKKKTLVIVQNYEEYQGFASDGDSEKKTQKRQRKDRETTQNNINNNELKNENNEKEKLRADIILYLNEKAGKKFSPQTVATRKLIDARLSEGRSVDDFKQVIDNKCKDWLGNNNMEKYLRPNTLFSGEKFEGYLNETTNAPKKNALSKDAEFQDWIQSGQDPELFNWN